MFPTMHRNVWLALLTATLCGCATLSKEECLNADWRMIGQQDGARGKPATQLDKHAAACEKAQVTPEAAAYEAGRTAGLLDYCTPSGGYSAGLTIYDYQNVCPAPLEAAFLVQYRNARMIRESRAEVDRLQNQIDAQEYTLSNDKASAQARSQAGRELRQLYARIGAAKADLRRLQRDYPPPQKALGS